MTDSAPTPSLAQVLASARNPFFDSRWGQFAKQGLVEDRRNDKPIDTVTWPRPDGVLQLPNVFEEGDGTMVALNPKTDFVPQPAMPSKLSIDAGVNDIQPISKLIRSGILR